MDLSICVYFVMVKGWKYGAVKRYDRGELCVWRGQNYTSVDWGNFLVMGEGKWGEVVVAE